MSDPRTVKEGSLEHTELSEEWRDFPVTGTRWPKEAGYIRRLPKGEKYLITRLVGTDGKIISRRVHILVALAFLGPKPTPKSEVNHRNGDKLDNRLANLEYLTKNANEHHAAENALKAWGERSARHKLTEANVRLIRQIRWTPLMAAALAANFGVRPQTVRNARDGRTWRHLDSQTDGTQS